MPRFQIIKFAKKFNIENSVRVMSDKMSPAQRFLLLASIYNHFRTFFTKEKEVANKDLHKLRRQNTNLDTDRHERDKTLNHLRTRVAVLEQELKDKTQVRVDQLTIWHTILKSTALIKYALKNKIMKLVIFAFFGFLFLLRSYLEHELLEYALITLNERGRWCC